MLFGSDVCLSALCMFNVKCYMLYWSVFLPCLVYVDCLSALCCLVVMFVCLHCVVWL